MKSSEVIGTSYLYIINVCKQLNKKYFSESFNIYLYYNKLFLYYYHSTLLPESKLDVLFNFRFAYNRFNKIQLGVTNIFMTTLFYGDNC